MDEQIVLSLLILICSLSIAIPFRETEANINKYLGLLSLYHIVYVVFIFLSLIHIELSFPGTTMNWIGKISAVAFSLTFYFLIRKSLKKNDFILSLPLKSSYKKVLIVGLVSVAIMCTLTVMFSKGKVFDTEKLIYQISMPGLDEELWRGLILGLLIMFLKDVKYKFGHPAIWITTIIFALGHSLYFNNWELGFALDAFIITGALGYMLGWMTFYTRSILPALIFHNLINFSTNIIEMLIL